MGKNACMHLLRVVQSRTKILHPDVKFNLFIVRHSKVIRQFNVPFPNYSQICKPNCLQKSVYWTFHSWSGCRIFVRDCTAGIINTQT